MHQNNGIENSNFISKIYYTTLCKCSNNEYIITDLCLLFTTADDRPTHILGYVSKNKFTS